MNIHLQECLVRERLNEARALAARNRLVRSFRTGRLPVRVFVGLTLIRLGRFLAGGPPSPAAEPDRVTA
jgi:hypothetical protein